MDRKIAALVLAAVLVGLCAYSGGVADANFPYPTAADIFENLVEVGENVYVDGVVSGSDENSIVVKTCSGDLRVVGVSAGSGDRVEVFGTFTGNATITAGSAVVLPKFDFYAMFVRSLVGMVVLIFLFFRSWKFRGWRVVGV